MDIFSSGPFRVALLVWTPRAGAAALTVICKATFHLRPGESPLAAEQDLPNEEENHWNDDPSRSLCSPCDLIPRKPRADVLLVGNAFAPGLSSVRSLVARLIVGGIDKSISVFGERTFTRDGLLHDDAGFAKMPIRWERAAGGPDTRNPVGVRMQGSADAQGTIVVPNLQPVGFVLGRPTDLLPPVGFGPIAASWPERWEKLGRHAGSWPAPGWAEHPLPADLDPSFFNTAPRDQQIERLRDDERIVLENLHPDHPRLATMLPGVRPRAQIERPGKQPQPVEMTADTLWIDTDQGICTLTWRGQVWLERRNEPGAVRINTEQTERPTAALRATTSFPDIGPRGPIDDVPVDHDDGARTMMPLLGPTLVLPFVTGRPENSPMARAVGGGTSTSDPGVETRYVEEAPPNRSGDVGRETLRLSNPLSLGGARAMPFVTGPAAPPPLPVPLPAPPPDIIAFMPSPRAQSVGERASGLAPSPNIIPPDSPAPTHMGSALEASNTAAGIPIRGSAPPLASPVASIDPRPRASPREVLKLLWFDPKSVARVRKHAEWRVILAELELRLLEEGGGEDDDEARAGASDEPDPGLRRDIFEVLVKARPIGSEGVRLAMSEAIDDDGKFEPPLVLLAGELELPFDELAMLKATASAASPFALADKKLKEQLDVVEELLKTPWLQGSGSIVEGLTEKIKEAFTQGKRALGPEYLASHTERMLLEQRCYQTRTVFGKKWIRSLLGGSGVPVYVPEALRDELPMFKRVKVKMIGEVDMQEDQYESGGCAIKVVALGRVMG
ncbi:MAG: DUF2169 domain-containing protein [Byssovorax sp.]